VGRNEELDQLIAAFDRSVHEDHPNPQRSGCPDQTLLTRLASEPALGTESVLDHLRQCAACLDQLRDLRSLRKRLH
jgi:hypothetical protein